MRSSSKRPAGPARARELVTGLVALFAFGCGGPTAPSSPPAPSAVVPSVTAAPPMSSAPPAASALEALRPLRTASASDGLYFLGPNQKDTCALSGRWLVCLGEDEVALAVSATGHVLEPLVAGAPSFTLAPPPHAKGAWTLRMPSGQVLARRDDPYLASIAERLAGRVFVLVDPAKYAASGPIEAATTSDSITMNDAMLASMEMDAQGNRSCQRVLFFADPTWNRSIPLAAAPPTPRAGELGVRAYLLLQVRHPCDEPIDVRAKLPVRGAAGAAKLVADAQGEPLGLTLEGYKYAATFVVRSAKRDVVEHVLAMTAKSIRHQAE